MTPDSGQYTPPDNSQADAAILSVQPGDLRNVIEGSLQGILIHQDGRIRYANPAMAKMFDYDSPAELVGRDVWETFVVPENIPVLQERTRKLLAGERLPAHPGWRGVSRTGRDIWVATAASCIEWRGRPAVASFYLDITAAKKGEEEHRRLEGQIQHAQRLESLAVLAGGLAHDFNNLLSAMLGNAGLAQMHLPKDSVAHSMLREIETAALRAADLTRQMLAYAGKGQFVVEPADLADVVREMCALLTTILSKNAVLRLELAPAPMCGDVTQVRQIVMNLISNASEALVQGGTIVVRSGTCHADAASLRSPFIHEKLPEGNYAFIEVSDNGCGMTPAVVARVFDPFFTTKFTGRGLGMAAVLGIVRSHRGTIKVTSQPGVGSTFQVLFPAQPSLVRESAAPPAATAWKGEGVILIVDDEPAIRDMARRMVEALGFSALTAGDGHEGLEVFAARADRISAVLLDVTMPGMDGVQALHALRRLRPELPVFLSSGYSEQVVSERLNDVKPTGFIAKPYRLEQLQQTLAALRI